MQTRIYVDAFNLYYGALRGTHYKWLDLDSSDVRMATVSPSGAIGGTVLGCKTEEKGSDVNLATLLVKEGFRDLYDVAVVISNDSDLLLPIEVVKTDLGKPVGVFNPHQKPSSRLRKSASFYEQIRKGVLGASQFPATLSGHEGCFTKPHGW